MINKKMKKDKNLQIFLNEIKNNLNSQPRKIILFGSRARNEHTDESDYDMIFIFNEVKQEIKKKLNKVCVRLLIDYGMVISSFLFTEKDLKRKKYEPFIMNALKEGIVL